MTPAPLSSSTPSIDDSQTEDEFDMISNIETPSRRPDSLQSPLFLSRYCSNMARRTLGLMCLLLTVFMWTSSNFLASYIFSDHSYDKPFLVVYMNSSLFALSLIPIAFKHIYNHGGFDNVQDVLSQAWRERSLSPLGLNRGNKVTGWDGYKEDDFDYVYNDTAISERRRLFNDEFNDGPQRPDDTLSFYETARLSLEFSMIWFLGNYFASACLEYTSVSSVTILTSTSGVWTLIIGAFTKVESFTVRKLFGVLASLAGIILISSVDLSSTDNDESRGNFPHKSQQQIAIGDAMALFSAIIYGLYVIVLKVRIGNESRVNMPLFFGMVGIFNLLILWPLFPILHFTGIEPFEMPPSGKIWTVIILNSVFSFISDQAWAYAMLLTTPLVVTVGLSLTIPLSLIGEMIQYQQYASFLYWVGAGVVLLSFMFITHESKDATADGDDGDDKSDGQPLEPGVLQV